MRYHKPHWTKKQQRMLRDALERQAKGKSIVAYVVTDQHGLPCNGGKKDLKYQCKPYAVHKAQKGKLEPCTRFAVHGTLRPHKWEGCRVWIAEFPKPFEVESNKVVAKRRIIIGEILPADCTNPQVGIKIGIKDLAGADLADANLARANLARANLAGADLAGVYRPENDLKK